MGKSWERSEQTNGLTLGFTKGLFDDRIAVEGKKGQAAPGRPAGRPGTAVVEAGGHGSLGWAHSRGGGEIVRWRLDVFQVLAGGLCQGTGCGAEEKEEVKHAPGL